MWSLFDVACKYRLLDRYQSILFDLHTCDPCFSDVFSQFIIYSHITLHIISTSEMWLLCSETGQWDAPFLDPEQQNAMLYMYALLILDLLL